jgi:YbbR domain-containing protein
MTGVSSDGTRTTSRKRILSLANVNEGYQFVSISVSLPKGVSRMKLDAKATIVRLTMSLVW